MDVLRRNLLISIAAAYTGYGLVLSQTASANQSKGRRIDGSFFNFHMVWPMRAPYSENFPSVPFHGWRAIDPQTHWFNLEPRKGQWNFSKTDIAMRLMESRGIDVLFTLYGTPAWASSRPDLKGVNQAYGESALPKDIADWENYVRTVVRRYRGRISAYELWNEPRVREVDGEKALFSATELVELGKVAYRVIKEEDPDARLTTPTMDGGEGGIRRLDACLSAGGNKCADIVSFHYYGLPEDIPRYHFSLKRMLVKYRMQSLPVWNTESGYLIEDPTSPNTHPISTGAFARVLPDYEAAAWMARSLILAASVGIERFYWFMWDGRNMGLITNIEKKINATGVAYGVLYEWLVGKYISTASSLSDFLVFKIYSDEILSGYVVWTRDYKKREFNVPLDWGVRYINRLDGSRESLHSGALVSFADQPVYFEM